MQLEAEVKLLRFAPTDISRFTFDGIASSSTRRSVPCAPGVLRNGTTDRRQMSVS